MRLPLLLASCVAVTLSAGAEAFTVTTGSGRTVTVDVLTDNIIKVTNTLVGEKAHSTTLLDSQITAPFAGKVLDTPAALTVTTPTGVVATVNRADGSVSITAGANRAVNDPGIRTMADGERRLELFTTGSGSFYGAGERGHSLNLEGDTLVVYNRQNYGYTKQDPRISQMNITMPLFLSSNGYAIVFDDYAAARMVMGNPIVYTTESPDPISWYFVNGSGSLRQTVTELSALTGRQQLPPFWALGYITSKYGYHTEAETRGVIDTLRRNDYPVDGVVLDLYWYGKEEDMGRLAWDPDQWPNPEGMLRDLKADGVNLVAISQPYVLRNGRGVDNYNTLRELGAFVMDSTGAAPQEVKIWVGEGGMFDVSSPAARKWLRQRYKDLTDGGVTGWWGDLGEPEVHPETGRHANGLTARQYHNQYGNDWSQIISDLFAEEYPDTRLMTLMRGGTTGLQRFSVYPWSTDVSRSWGGLQPQVTIMLNSGLSGLGYMSHDVGGFAIDRQRPVDPELYVRWLQLGLFSPILRTHSQETAEPYKYPEQQNIIKPLIKARYQWLPYNYTLAYENAAFGLPLVRPINFYSPGSTHGDNVDDEFLWGRDVLVAPVLNQGVTERTIIFPDGQWVDARNPEKVYAVTDTITYPVSLETLPLFYRAGAFIPMADYAMKNVLEYRPDRFTVNYYPVGDTTSESILYDDNRMSPRSLADGQYRLITFRGDGKTITVSSEGSYEGAPTRVKFTFVVHNTAARTATVAGRKVKGVRYDSRTRNITIPIDFTPGTPLTINLTE